MCYSARPGQFVELAQARESGVPRPVRCISGSRNSVGVGRWLPNGPPRIRTCALTHPAPRSGIDVTPCGAAVPLRSGPASNPI